MCSINLLGLILYFSRVQTISLDKTDCIHLRTINDIEKTAFQLFNSLKMWQCLHHFTKSMKHLNLYMFNKITAGENCKTFTDIVNISTAIYDNEQNESESFIDIKKGEYLWSKLQNLILQKIVKDTIVQELVENIPVLTEKANVSLEFERTLRNTVNKTLRDTVHLHVNVTENTTAANQRKKKHKLTAWEFNVTRRQGEDMDTDIKHFPFMASIFENGEFICSGCIIRKELIISAASCLHNVYLNQKEWPAVTVRVLSNNLHTGGHVVSVTEAVFHPNYDHNTLKNNLVLLNVPQDYFIKLPGIKRLMYQDTKAKHEDFNENIRVLGWNEHPVSNVDRVHDDTPIAIDQVNDFNNDQCKQFYNREFHSNIFCAASRHHKYKYAVGSPSIVNSMLLGILSFTSERKGTTTAPVMVFTRIAPYVNWIYEVQHKILPILHAAVKKGDKKKRKFINARRIGSHGHRYHARRKLKNSRKTSGKSHNNLEQNITNIIDVLTTLAENNILRFNGNLDAIKNSVIEVLAKSGNKTNAGFQDVAALVALAARYLEPERGIKKTAKPVAKHASTKDDSMNLHWNIFIDEETTTVDKTNVVTTTTAKVPAIIDTTTEVNSHNIIHPREIGNDTKSHQMNKQPHLLNDIIDIANSFVQKTISKKVHKRRIPRRKRKPRIRGKHPRKRYNKYRN